VEQNTPKSIGRQIVGGGRDAVQSWLDWPTSMLNVVSEYVNTQPPHATRQRQVPELAAPVQLPTVREPATSLERGVRLGSQLSTDVLSTLMLPAVRAWAAQKIFGVPATMKSVPLLYEDRRVVSRPTTGWGPVPTLARPGGPLAEPLSEGAVNVSRLLALPDTVEGIARMSQAEAARARGVLQRVASGDPGLLTDASTPLGQLYLAVEQQLLRYR
jgi:hypothetical protein